MIIKRKVDMVHYCPGDSVGMPAGLSRAEAERQQSKDMDYVTAMRLIGLKVDQLPHIGGSCPRCRRKES
jgi:hypothetical protein